MAVTHKEAGAKLDPLSLLALGASGDYPLELNFSDQVLDDMQAVAKARLAIGSSGVVSYTFALEFKDDRWVLADWYSRCPISLGFVAITKWRELRMIRVNIRLFDGQTGELNHRDTLLNPPHECPELTPEFWRSYMADPEVQGMLCLTAHELLTDSCRKHLEKGV